MASGSYAASPFEAGRRLFAEKKFDAAAQAFEQAIRTDPKMSKYHLWLGRAYGRLAERSSWFRAIDLAMKTRSSLERAVDLDPNNTEALVDLMDYYNQAPGFLGGSQEKAEEIRKQLEKLKRRGGSRTAPTDSRAATATAPSSPPR
jgi:tetratricopeptide (TPR) repeat protein